MWRIDVGAECAERLAARFLSPSERERAGRLVNPMHGWQFVAARAGLRAILGELLGCAGAGIELILDANGKPRLCPRAHVAHLHFNLSHSHEHAVAAFAVHRHVGVDIEWHNPDRETARLARRFYRPAEIAAINAEPTPAGRLAAFYRCWTRKEAYVKATGDGLRFPTRRFEVSVREDEPCRLLAVDGRPGEAARWRMEPLPVPAHYSGTVAAEGSDWRLEHHPMAPGFPAA
jgi:4'-phosphopantetheinyl transferase